MKCAISFTFEEADVEALDDLVERIHLLKSTIRALEVVSANLKALFVKLFKTTRAGNLLLRTSVDSCPGTNTILRVSEVRQLRSIYDPLLWNDL